MTLSDHLHFRMLRYVSYLQCDQRRAGNYRPAIMGRQCFERALVFGVCVNVHKAATKPIKKASLLPPDVFVDDYSR